ncbi:MAG TPA: SurA N-terminal domain-containing protein [Solirubrobacterales bacterium]|nr:SurA N-terminal domain-containing protein [Solirubrobacterales bacterium]
MGAKAGKKGAPRGRSDKDAGRQRLALIVFGALLVLLFVGFAVTQGIGSPSVPSGDVAVVEDVPGDAGRISEKDLERAVEQQVAEAKLKKTPEPGSDKYEELRDAAFGEMLERTWIFGQAEELDVSITDKQVEDELATIKKSNFGSEKAYQKFLKESKFTEEDVNERVRLQLLSTKVQEAVSASAPPPSESQIENYYAEQKDAQFTEKESRDVRVIINKDKAEVEAAKKALEADNSPGSWKKVAAKYSIDPTSKTKGGLQKGISEEFVKGPLKAAIFGSATGELAGPVKFEQNYILVEVVKLNPEKSKSLAEVKSQISSTLSQEQQQEFFSEFVSDFRTKWEQRTQCADGFVIERCSNFVGDGRPANAPPACYEADPKTPATQCPAPVTPISPALPGTVTEAKPKGEPFPQRPLPEASAEQGEEVPAGAVPGAAPEGEAPPAETGE